MQSLAYLKTEEKVLEITLQKPVVYSVTINLTKAEIAYNFSGSDLNKWLRMHCH